MDNAEQNVPDVSGNSASCNSECQPNSNKISVLWQIFVIYTESKTILCTICHKQLRLFNHIRNLLEHLKVMHYSEHFPKNVSFDKNEQKFEYDGKQVETYICSMASLCSFTRADCRNLPRNRSILWLVFIWNGPKGVYCRFCLKHFSSLTNEMSMIHHLRKLHPEWEPPLYWEYPREEDEVDVKKTDLEDVKKTGEEDVKKTDEEDVNKTDEDDETECMESVYLFEVSDSDSDDYFEKHWKHCNGSDNTLSASTSITMLDIFTKDAESKRMICKICKEVASNDFNTYILTDHLNIIHKGISVKEIQALQHTNETSDQKMLKRKISSEMKCQTTDSVSNEINSDTGTLIGSPKINPVPLKRVKNEISDRKILTILPIRNYSDKATVGCIKTTPVFANISTSESMNQKEIDKLIAEIICEGFQGPKIVDSAGFKELFEELPVINLFQ